MLYKPGGNRPFQNYFHTQPKSAKPQSNTQINSLIATTTERSFACNCKYLIIRCVLISGFSVKYSSNKITETKI
nr:hypothetical protein CFP56_06013 [Quercus suber]